MGRGRDSNPPEYPTPRDRSPLQCRHDRALMRGPREIRRQLDPTCAGRGERGREPLLSGAWKNRGELFTLPALRLCPCAPAPAPLRLRPRQQAQGVPCAPGPGAGGPRRGGAGAGPCPVPPLCLGFMPPVHQPQGAGPAS